MDAPAAAPDAPEFVVRIDKCTLCDIKRYIKTPNKLQDKPKIMDPLDPKIHCERDMRAGLTFQVFVQ
jgi:hypothetical protein